MKELTIINLTSVNIKLYPDEYSDIDIPVDARDMEKFLNRCIDISSQGSAKSEIFRDEDSIRAIIKGSNRKTVRLSYSHVGIISGLPLPKDDTLYIVSQLTFNAVHHLRKDVAMIDKPIRSKAGGVIACRGLSRCVYDKSNKQLDTIEKYLKKRFSELKPGIEAEEVINCISLLTEYRKK